MADRQKTKRGVTGFLVFVLIIQAVSVAAQSSFENRTPPFYGREDFRLVVDGDLVLLIGGAVYDDEGNGTCFNDLWETKDFKQWEKISDNIFSKAPPFVGTFWKDGHLILFNGAVTNKNITLEFVKVDGRNLEKIQYEEIPEECINSNDAVVFELALTGYFNYTSTRYFASLNSGLLIDSLYGVWKKDSGKWKKILDLDDVIDSSRVYSTISMHDNQVFLAGGFRNGVEDLDGYCNDVWKSRDGLQWERVSVKTGPHEMYRDDFKTFPARAGAVAVSFKGKIYLVGGFRRERYYYDDVWASSDGVVWKRVSGKAYSFVFKKSEFTQSK
jgi:hypothetical protein